LTATFPSDPLPPVVTLTRNEVEDPETAEAAAPPAAEGDCRTELEAGSVAAPPPAAEGD